MTTLNLGDAFTPEGTQGTVQPVEEVKETPTEAPAVEKPVEDTQEIVETPKQDAGELEKQLQGLQTERERLLEELKHLRGTRRELKQEQLIQVQKDIVQTSDDLKDVNPDDAHLIERVAERLLRQKGYVPKDEINKMYYKSVQDQVVSEFCEKYPEYKPDVDTQNINWNTLNRELADYVMPQNPHDIMRVLEKAHKAISRTPSDQGLAAKQRAVQTASAGAGGVQKSSSQKTLTPTQRKHYEDGGWSEAEIKEIESKL